MKKIIGLIVVAVVCAGVICGAFYLTAQRSKNQAQNVETLTEVQKIITKNLDTKYPETPREVVKLYTRIITAYNGVSGKFVRGSIVRFSIVKWLVLPKSDIKVIYLPLPV